MEALPTQRIEALVLELLAAHPAGLSEYELFKGLDRKGLEGFADPVFHDPLALFRSHFLLFHVLYRLADRLVREDSGRLAISPLCVRLHPGRAATTGAVDRPDPLRSYYLDLENLSATDAAQVNAMLGRFWARLDEPSQRAEALAVLGLEEPVDEPTIRRRYRRLVMEHHPDRGGDKERLQALNAAMATLRLK